METWKYIWDSDFLKLFVVLIAIITIVLLFLRHRKNDVNNKTYAYYIIGLGVFIIIELVTYICLNNDNTTDIVRYISFASTISSLFLSVVAIVYAFISNDKGEKQYQKLDAVSDRIIQSSNQITQSLDDFSNLSKNMSDNINIILDQLGEIKDISYDTKNAIASSSQPKTNNTEGSEIIDNLYDNYIKDGSFSGNLALLACCYSFEKNKKFVISEIFGANAAYCYGYIAASTLVGIIETNTENGVVTVGDIYFEDMKIRLLKFLNDVIDETANLKHRISIKGDLNKVKRYFDIVD